MTKKLAYITFLQSFAVVLVCLGHSFPSDNVTNNIPYIYNTIFNLLYSFHMPLFFAIGGFLFLYSMEKNNYQTGFKEFFIKKSKRLIIPYAVIGTIAFLLKAFIFNSFAYRPVKPSLTFYINSMLYPQNNPNIYLWFLPVIFVILIIAFFILKRSTVIKSLVFSFLLLFLIKYIQPTFFKIVIGHFCYFVFGGLIYVYKDTLFKLLNKIYFLISLIVLFCIAFTFLKYCLFIKVLTALLGILASFSFAVVADSKNIKFFGGIIDGKYYQIYLLSWFAQCGLRLLYQLNIVNYHFAVIIMFLGGILFSLLVSYLIAKFLPRFKICIGL